MYNQVLYDRIIDDQPIPNGMDDDSIIDIFIKKGDWLKYSFLINVPIFSTDIIALSSESSSGIYPICIREPSILNPYVINTLLLSADERTISLMQSGAIKLCWFVVEEPLKDVHRIFDIEIAMRNWEIDNYAIFCNLPLAIIAKGSKHLYPSGHFEEFACKSLNKIPEPVQESKRFNIFMFTINIYDWRLFILDLLKRAKILDHTLLTFNYSASMINTDSIRNSEVTSYLAQNETTIRDSLKKLSYHHYINVAGMFEHSSFSIVLDGYINDKVVQYPYITEKTMRPLVFGQPFVVYGQPRSLSHLHERGYRTFHPYIDESYDRIDDDMLRFKTLTDELVRINSLSHDEFEDLLKKIEPITAHNVKCAKENLSTYYTRIFETI